MGMVKVRAPAASACPGQVGQQLLPNGGAGNHLQLFHQGQVLLRNELHHVFNHPVVKPADQLAGVENPPIVQQEHRLWVLAW